ncbi:MAG: hypothetical protein V1889_00505 [archaeon]
MADGSCEYIGDRVPPYFSMRSEGESFECKVTNGVCGSNNFRECVVYNMKKEIEGMRDGKKDR